MDSDIIDKHNNNSVVCRNWDGGNCPEDELFDNNHLRDIIEQAHNHSVGTVIIVRGINSGTNVSLVSILVGVLFVLSIIAIILRYRQAKIAQEQRQISLANFNFNLSSNQISHPPTPRVAIPYLDGPPDYRSVLQCDDQLPSYEEVAKLEQHRRWDSL